MTPGALAALRRLRRAALDASARALAEAQGALDRAEANAHAAHRRLDAERDAATDLAASDAEVEAYAAWLPRGRALVTEAETARTQAMDDANLARHRLAAARVAMEAADMLAAHQRAQARAPMERAEREALQEANLRPREAD